MSEVDEEKRRNVIQTLRERRGKIPTHPRPVTVSSGANNLRSSAGRQAGGRSLLQALAQNASGAKRRHLRQSSMQDHENGRAFAAPANLRFAFAPADLRTAAREAWIFCLPLIETARVRMLAGLRFQRSGTGINSFGHSRELATPAERLITAPNVDTLYSGTFIDLKYGPATVALPPTGERYISLQLMDMYTNTFAVLSTRTIGCDGGTFTIVGPRDAAPDGAMRSPTEWIWAMVRIALNGPDELGEVHRIQDGILLQASPARTLGRFAQRHSPWREYFSSASTLLEENPPPATDQAVLGRMAALGLAPGRVFDPNAFDAAQLADIQAGVDDVWSVIASRPERSIEGWAYADADPGNWAQNYVRRARAAVGGLAALPRQEAMYMHAVTPDGNHRFTEGNWRLRFSSDQLPPVYAFWSLTAYEVTPQGQYFLADNPLNRYSIGDRTQDLRRNDDGSFDIWISRQNPGGEKTDNWLPAPEDGPYSLHMRAYLPKQELLTGVYRLPPLMPA